MLANRLFKKLGTLTIFDNLFYRFGIISLGLLLATLIPALTQVSRLVYAAIVIVVVIYTANKLFPRK